MKKYKEYISPEIEKVEYTKDEVLGDVIAQSQDETMPSGGGDIGGLI